MNANILGQTATGHECDAEGGFEGSSGFEGGPFLGWVVPRSFVPAIEPVKLGIWRMQFGLNIAQRRV